MISIGIGGSYLGPEFVYEALRNDPVAHKAAEGRDLHFVANVDPLDIARNVEKLDAERTLIVIVSKTFTTAETMLNARSLRRWLLEKLAYALFPPCIVAARRRRRRSSRTTCAPCRRTSPW